jgi:cold-inducible RNA-binding protein
MSKKLYVGNLSYESDEQTIRSLFEDGGWPTEEVAIITDRDTGRPRGFGFVTLTNSGDAEAAITALNGREVGGRAIVVNEAKERTDRGGGGGGRGGGGDRRGGGGGWGRRDGRY